MEHESLPDVIEDFKANSGGADIPTSGTKVPQYMISAGKDLAYADWRKEWNIPNAVERYMVAKMEATKNPIKISEFRSRGTLAAAVNSRHRGINILLGCRPPGHMEGVSFVRVRVSSRERGIPLVTRQFDWKKKGLEYLRSFKNGIWGQFNYYIVNDFADRQDRNMTNGIYHDSSISNFRGEREMNESGLNVSVTRLKLTENNWKDYIDVKIEEEHVWKLYSNRTRMHKQKSPHATFKGRYIIMLQVKKKFKGLVISKIEDKKDVKKVVKKDGKKREESVKNDMDVIVPHCFYHTEFEGEIIEFPRACEEKLVAEDNDIEGLFLLFYSR